MKLAVLAACFALAVAQQPTDPSDSPSVSPTASISASPSASVSESVTPSSSYVPNPGSPSATPLPLPSVVPVLTVTDFYTRSSVNSFNQNSELWVDPWSRIIVDINLNAPHYDFNLYGFNHSAYNGLGTKVPFPSSYPLLSNIPDGATQIPSGYVTQLPSGLVTQLPSGFALPSFPTQLPSGINPSQLLDPNFYDPSSQLPSFPAFPSNYPSITEYPSGVTPLPNGFDNFGAIRDIVTNARNEALRNIDARQNGFDEFFFQENLRWMVNQTARVVRKRVTNNNMRWTWILDLKGMTPGNYTFNVREGVFRRKDAMDTDSNQFSYQSNTVTILVAYNLATVADQDGTPIRNGTGTITAKRPFTLTVREAKKSLFFFPPYPSPSSVWSAPPCAVITYSMNLNEASPSPLPSGAIADAAPNRNRRSDLIFSVDASSCPASTLMHFKIVPGALKAGLLALQSGQFVPLPGGAQYIDPFSVLPSFPSAFPSIPAIPSSLGGFNIGGIFGGFIPSTFPSTLTIPSSIPEYIPYKEYLRRVWDIQMIQNTQGNFFLSIAPTPMAVYPTLTIGDWVTKQDVDVNNDALVIVDPGQQIYANISLRSNGWQSYLFGFNHSQAGLPEGESDQGNNVITPSPGGSANPTASPSSPPSGSFFNRLMDWDSLNFDDAGAAWKWQWVPNRKNFYAFSYDTTMMPPGDYKFSVRDGVFYLPNIHQVEANRYAYPSNQVKMSVAFRSFVTMYNGAAQVTNTTGTVDVGLNTIFSVSASPNTYVEFPAHGGTGFQDWQDYLEIPDGASISYADPIDNTPGARRSSINFNLDCTGCILDTPLEIRIKKHALKAYTVFGTEVRGTGRPFQFSAYYQAAPNP